VAETSRPDEPPDVEEPADCSYFRRWRDPDSNRGHHDFQGLAVRSARLRETWKTRCSRSRDSAALPAGFPRLRAGSGLRGRREVPIDQPADHRVCASTRCGGAATWPTSSLWSGPCATLGSQTESARHTVLDSHGERRGASGDGDRRQRPATARGCSMRRSVCRCWEAPHLEWRRCA
jgi:hypothetical protein